MTCGKQLTFLDTWWEEVIGLKMQTDLSLDKLTIKDFHFNFDSHYKHLIGVEFDEIKAMQVFNSKEHFLNYFKSR